MKNVTGYDLVKFLAGSYGTLAVLSRGHLQGPADAGDRSRRWSSTVLTTRRAVAALSAALGSPYEVTGAAHVPGRDGDVARTLIRLEGFADSVAERTPGDLRRCWPISAAPRCWRADASRALWRVVGDLEALGAPAEAAVWRVSVKPSDGPTIAAAARAAFACRVLYDWGGGLVWIATGRRLRRRRRGDPRCDPRRSAAMRRWSGRPTRVRARRRRLPAAGAAADGPDAQAEGDASIRPASSTPAACMRVCEAETMQTNFPLPSLPIRIPRRRRRFSAPACIAASAPRPARPICCSATSSTARAAAST